MQCILLPGAIWVCGMSTGERVCWGLTVLGAGMVAAPFVLGEALEPMGDARFAMVFVGVILAPSFFISAFLFRRRNRVRTRLRAGRDLLAHWTYSAAEWQAFAGEEARRQASGKGMLLGITAAIMLVVTVGFTALNRQAGPFVGLVLLVVWIACWLAARASMKSCSRRAAGPVPEARIGPDGLLLGDEFHLWRGWGGRLEGCKGEEGMPAVLAITYSMPGRNQRLETTVRVPVPAGREAEAAQVAQRLGA